MRSYAALTLRRVTGHKQITDGHYYSTAYSYNLSGQLVEQTYPSGRKVKNSFEVDGATNVLKLDYSYSTTGNNGNVNTQSITVPGLTNRSDKLISTIVF